jgi:dolichol-phosphate mannosyltransferase
MKVVVIIPTYNEKDNIIKLLDVLEEEKKQITRHLISFLVVDDTSPDGTGDVVSDYREKHKDVFIISGKKEGLGKALLRGIKYAIDMLHADILVQMDADLSHDPKKFPEFIHVLDRGADFAIGSRYIPGGSIPENWGLHRKLYSIVGNAFVRFGLGELSVHDWTGGYRAYKKRYFELAKSDMHKYRGYVYQIAFLHKSIKNGAKVVEIPFHFTDRMFGRSKIAPMEYIQNILLYVASERFKTIFSGSFGKFLVVGGIGFVINAVILVVLHDWFAVAAAPANMVGAGVAIFSNFNLNNVWTFQGRKILEVRNYVAKLMQFYGTSVFGVLVIQTGIIEVGVRTLGDRWYFFYFLVGTALLLVWNYIMYSRIIWKKKE